MVAVGAVAVGRAAQGWLPAGSTVQHTVPAAELAAALTALDQLEVRGRAPMTGYDRALFGDGWGDLDLDGCDTRNEVLARDLVAPVLDPDGCLVLSGTLVDPYGGTTIDFVRGPHSDAVQIDHVVPLADAWQKGAQQWTAQRREQFANDQGNLLAVEGELNQAKGAGDAATWLPPVRGFRCAYAIRQVLVKAEYGLWVTSAEREALTRQLDGCVVADG